MLHNRFSLLQSVYFSSFFVLLGFNSSLPPTCLGLKGFVVVVVVNIKNISQKISFLCVSNDDLPPLVTIPSKKMIEQVWQTKIYCLVPVIILHVFVLTIDLLQASLSYTSQFTDIQDMDIDHPSQ